MKQLFNPIITLTRREYLRFIRIWIQTIVPPIITTSLYFVIFGNLIGERIGKINGVSYSDFIAPGLILMSVITNSYANTVSSFFSAKLQNHIQELVVAPIGAATIMFGYIMGGVLRGIIVGSIVFLTVLFFTDSQIKHVFLFTVVIFFTSILFSSLGLINGIFSSTFEDINIVPSFILTPLTYLGGVFFSITMLSDLWYQLALFNPLLYAIDALRFTMLGNSDIQFSFSLTIIVTFTIISLIAVTLLLRNGKGMKID